MSLQITNKAHRESGAVGAPGASAREPERPWSAPGLVTLFFAALDWFIPEDVRADPEDHRRSRMLVGGSFFLAVIVLALLARRVAFEQTINTTVELMALGAGVVITTPFALRFTSSHRVAGTMCTLAAVGLLTVGTYLNGGFGTLALFWFPAVPLVSMFFVGRWLAALTGTLLVIDLSVLYVLHQTGHAFPASPNSSEYQAFYLSGAIFSVLFTVLFASLYESARERAQRARERSEERYALAVAGAKDVLWDWQMGQPLPYFSPRLMELIGHDVALYRDFGGLLTLVHPDDREPTREAVAQCLRTGGTLEIELRIVTASGEVRWFDARGQGVGNLLGSVVRMAGSLRDITRAKQTETELAARAAELERSNRDLEQFAYVASHDLREPLRTVSSFAQLLARRYEGQLGPEADEYISAIVDGGQRMHALIRDLLDYARLSRRQEPAMPTSLSDALDAAIADLRARITEAGATIERGPLPPVLGDPHQMARLFQNLLSNALKFHGEAAPVVRVSAERFGNAVVVEVKDNGIGLEPAHADRIFEIFQRLHTRDRYPGTGIGLAVCKRIVEQSGGRIWVDSSPGNGATFKVSMPALDV